MERLLTRRLQMGIAINSQSGNSLSRPDMANINDIVRKAPEPKAPEPVEFAKADIKAPERITVEIEKPQQIRVEPKVAQTQDVASYASTSQGDDLAITQAGMQSAKLGGAVQASEENGAVAKKETIEISNTTEAGIKLREQLQEIRDSKAKAIHDAVENLEAHDTSVNERQKYMIAANASVTLSNPDYLSEEVKNPVKVEETKEDEIV